MFCANYYRLKDYKTELKIQVEKLSVLLLSRKYCYMEHRLGLNLYTLETAVFKDVKIGYKVLTQYILVGRKQ